MLTLATQVALIPAEYGALRESTLGILQAMQDPARGFPLLGSLLYVNTDSAVYRARLSSASTGKATRAHNAAFTGANPTVSTYDFPLVACGGDLTVDRNDMSGKYGPMNRAGLLGRQAMDVGGRLFDKFFHGDKTNTDEFQGVDAFCDANARSLELVATGRAVTTADVEAALALCPGCNLILCNAGLAIDVDNLDDGKYRRTIDVPQGAAIPPGAYQKTYRGIPIMQVNQFASSSDGSLSPILPFTEAPTTQGTANVNDVCSRITFVRLGLGGVHAVQRELFKLDQPQIIKEAENNHMNWYSAHFATDDLFSVYQLKSVKKAP